MKVLNVLFLWHMHQPCYLDGMTGKITLPWVRLHATKAYYDMPLVASEFPEVKVTLNVVPSLIEQIRYYTVEKKTDLFYDYSAKPVQDLSDEEKAFILRYFFSCNWKTMIQPRKEYWALLVKRGLAVSKETIDKNTKRFTNQNFTDLQCWFNLAWFGFKALENKPFLKELINKGKNFTEDDKKTILATQLEILSEIPDIYKKLLSSGQTDISLTPYYHPILPLLINTDSASIAMPGATLPQQFSYPEDAQTQITEAIAMYKETFGKEPHGMWPSEGSVSPQAAEIIRKSGITWIATDEEVLGESLGGLKNRDQILKPYVYPTQYGDLNLFFRDKNISNLISFTYHRQSDQTSVENFADHLEKIREHNESEDPTLSIILDGENPWEYYHDRGAGFLRGVYGFLAKSDKFRARTFSEVAWISKDKGRLSKLHTGSWINHNFDIWIGKPGTNKAWELLKKTREVLTSTIINKHVDDEAIKTAWKELHKAEGSDWFWWLSDYFYSDNAEEFDRLFRTHLLKIYDLIQVGPPWQLQTQAGEFKSAVPPTRPKGLISPIIDGKVTNFYEWSNAGTLEVQKMGSFMFEGKKFLNSIHYGFDLDNLYLRIDPIVSKNGNNHKGCDYSIDLVTGKYYRIIFQCGEDKKSFTLLESPDRLNYVPAGQFNTLAIGKIAELSIPFSAIEAKSKETVRFAVCVKCEGMEMNRYPRNDYLSFDVPTQDFEQITWMV